MSGEKNKKNKKQEKYVPEIIEAVDNEGNGTWYFALIKAGSFKAYETARDEGRVDIKRNDEGVLFVCIDGNKCGQIIESGEGEPSPEQKEAFIKEHGIPCLQEDGKKKDGNKTPENDTGGNAPPQINEAPPTGPWPS